MNFLKLSFLFGSVVLLQAGLASARSTAPVGTAVYEEAPFLRAALNAENDSETLYNTLRLKAVEGRSGSTKSFKTKDGAVEVLCSSSILPVGIPFGCTLSIDMETRSPDTAVYKEDGFLHAAINNVADAKKLYWALVVRQTAGRSGSYGSFQSTDYKAGIYCTKSALPVGIPYACTVSIALNK